MIVYYKLFDLLRKRKITQKELLNNKVLASGTLQRLRTGGTIASDTLSALCEYLGCQLEDIAEYVPDSEENTRH